MGNEWNDRAANTKTARFFLGDSLMIEEIIRRPIWYTLEDLSEITGITPSELRAAAESGKKFDVFRVKKLNGLFSFEADRSWKIRPSKLKAGA